MKKWSASISAPPKRRKLAPNSRAKSGANLIPIFLVFAPSQVDLLRKYGIRRAVHHAFEAAGSIPAAEAAKRETVIKCFRSNCLGNPKVGLPVNTTAR